MLFLYLYYNMKGEYIMDELNFLSQEQKSDLQSKVSKMNYDDLKRQVQGIDKNQVMNKLRSLGLGSIADKYANTSDDEIMRLLANNPDILKKINQLLK